MSCKDIDKEIDQRCKDLGFKKKKYNYYKPLTDSTMAIIGFGRTSFSQTGRFFINAIIGVFRKDIDDIYSRLTGYTCAKHMQPTIGIQLGYLMPINDYYEWDIVDGEDNHEKFDDIFFNIKKYGFPYQSEMADLDNVFAAFYRRDRGILNTAREKILPILYYMKGEKEKGADFIHETIERNSAIPTDEELLAGRNKEKTILLRAGEEPNLTADDLRKMLKRLPDGGSFEIVSAGYNGQVDPSYLEFAERYMQLP